MVHYEIIKITRLFRVITMYGYYIRLLLCVGIGVHIHTGENPILFSKSGVVSLAYLGIDTQVQGMNQYENIDFYV